MSEAAETVTACPECDKHRICAREKKTPTWFCRECRAEFEEPKERERRRHGESHPDPMYGQGAYKELELALWRTLDAGTRYATARIITEYTAELNHHQIARLLDGWAVDDGLVSVWSDNGNRTRYCIAVDGGVDDG